MADISIRKPHGGDRQSARVVVEEKVQKALDRFGVNGSWAGDRLTIKGKGARGSLEITDQEVRIEISLGLLGRPFRGKIAEGIERALDKAFG